MPTYNARIVVHYTCEIEADTREDAERLAGQVGLYIGEAEFVVPIEFSVPEADNVSGGALEALIEGEA